MSDPWARPVPGERLVFRWRKWDGAPHWRHDCLYLGADEWGDWLGQPAGWRSERPGRVLIAPADNVTLVPHDCDFALTHNQPPAQYLVYIDLAWDVRWQDAAPSAIDMDLDVVRTPDGDVRVEDEDEWAEHRAALAYPSHVVTRLEHRAGDLRDRVAASTAPFDQATADRWRRRLAALAPRPRLDG